jgi:hypothetical protein
VEDLHVIVMDYGRKVADGIAELASPDPPPPGRTSSRFSLRDRQDGELRTEVWGLKFEVQLKLSSDAGAAFTIVCSAKNRLLVRAFQQRIIWRGRWRSVYFAVFLRRAEGTGADHPSLRRAVGVRGAAEQWRGLLLMAALVWLLPSDSGLLAFSDAETNLLLPAPVTRRQLLIHRLLRSQLPLLFGAVISSVFVPMAVGARLRFGAEASAFVALERRDGRRAVPAGTAAERRGRRSR